MGTGRALPIPVLGSAPSLQSCGFVCTGLMTLAHTPRHSCSSVPCPGLAHPPAPLPACWAVDRNIHCLHGAFWLSPLCQCLLWGPSVPLWDGDGVRHRDRNRDRDRQKNGVGAGRCFPAEVTWHSLTHRPGDGSWFQLHPPAAQSWFPAWVTMGTAGWGETTPGRWQKLSHPVGWWHETPFFPGTSVGLLGWQGCAGGQWGWLGLSCRSRRDPMQGVKDG